MKATITLENGQVYQGDVELVPDASGGSAGPATGTAILGISGGAPTTNPTVVKLPAVLSAISVPDVPQAREIVISVADGAGFYYLTVKDPAGNVCQQTPVPIPGGEAPRGPAENVQVVNAGQVEASITTPGTYIAEIRADTYRGTETVEAHVN